MQWKHSTGHWHAHLLWQVTHFTSEVTSSELERGIWKDWLYANNYLISVFTRTCQMMFISQNRSSVAKHLRSIFDEYMIELWNLMAYLLDAVDKPVSNKSDPVCPSIINKHEKMPLFTLSWFAYFNCFQLMDKADAQYMCYRLHLWVICCLW